MEERAPTPRLLLPALLILSATPATGQILRGEARLAATTTCRGQAIAAPRERLPAAGPGTVATARLVVTAWIERPTTTNRDEIRLARSLDGGWSWQPAAVIYTAAVGERLASTTNDGLNGVRLACSGHTVFVAYTSDKAVAADQENVYALASPDQGQTWSAELLVNTTTANQGRDADELVIAADSLGNCHFAYEHDLLVNEDVFYASARLTGTSLTLVTPETRLNKGVAPGVADVDTCDIAVESPVVAVTWRDDRQAAGANQVFVIVSTNNGNDFGSPAVTEQLISRNGAIGAPRRSQVAVAGANVYVAWEDSRTNTATGPGFDEVYCAVSNNAGGNWAEYRVNDSPLDSGDVDNVVVAARGSTVVLAWEDERNAVPFGLADYNWGDDIYVVVDRQAGAGLAAGIANVRLDVNSPTNGRSRSEQPQIAMADHYVAVTWEESWNNGGAVTLTNEDVCLSVSRDDGLSWDGMRFMTERGSAFFTPGTDINDPRVVLTRNHDLVIAQLDADLGGRSHKVHAVKLPELRTRFLGAATLEVSNCRDTDAGNLALVLVTNSTSLAPLPLDGLGFEPYFAFTNVTFILFNTGFYFSFVDTAGRATFPLAPDGGGAFTAVAIGLDPVTLQFTWFSDPARY